MKIDSIRDLCLRILKYRDSPTFMWSKALFGSMKGMSVGIGSVKI